MSAPNRRVSERDCLGELSVPPCSMGVARSIRPPPAFRPHKLYELLFRKAFAMTETRENAQPPSRERRAAPVHYHPRLAQDFDFAFKVR